MAAGIGDGVQDALVVGHVGQGGPALEGAEGRAHRRAEVLRSGGAVGRVPGVVLLDGAVEQYGDTVPRAEEKIGRPARPAQVAAALRTAAVKAQEDAGMTACLAVVSAADPVHRATGRLIHLPDAPFLLGELNPAEVLAPHLDGPVTVDNDVNWAVQAERDHARTGALNDFAYVFLGEGLGAAIISDGEIRRGHTGLAGELAHLITAGPRGQAMPLIEVFGELGLRQAGSTAIDVGRLLTAATGPAPQAVATRQALGQAISGALAAAVAFAAPEVLIIGGPWGSHPLILDTISEATARLPRHAPVRAAELIVEPSLAGARSDALSRLRSGILAAACQ